ncbi:hypothetical protein OIE66_12790 [Nonomuraea sp. NBC_01738]|uniref:hypothetical protein n=1 Tax=Nonomuraea sp. NBC_01738 TaxID=2976003 RepID=UPI002E0F761C|nr:hypothetical protein OIE66_12790 [Nonomuraea sp. NBC_01738]
MGDLPVYDVVLLPPPDVDAASIRLSGRLAAQVPVEFVLSQDLRYPHLSLYMANLTPADCEKAQKALDDLALRTPALPLAATHFAGNEHGMFEVFYTRTPELVRLQTDVIAAVGPLRTGLRELDPVGRVIAEHRLTAPAEARDNLDRHGYDEIGGLFKPHITVTRFRERGHVPGELPDPGEFTTVYRTLALCVMGEHGTCTDVVAAYELRG